jgi:class 3 adenylate cyclase
MRGIGDVLASGVADQLVKDKDFEFSDRGEVSLKGFDDPVRLHEVRWRDE